MKKALLLTLVLVCCSSLAFGQAGKLGVFADMAGNECNTVDAAAGLLTVYVVHMMAQATASQFSAPTPACFVGATYLADAQMFPVTVGNTQTGVAVGYGSCLSSPIAVIGIQYFAAGLATPCCFFPVVPDPAAATGQIEVVDCASTLLAGAGIDTNTINGNATCDCQAALPVEESTWGKVKSLYE